MSKNLTLTDTMSNLNSGERLRYLPSYETEWSDQSRRWAKITGGRVCCTWFQARLQNCESEYEPRHICLPVCPFTCYNSASNGRLSWNMIFEGFSKICLENWVWLNSGKNNGYFTWRCRHIHDYISLKYFRQVCRENQNTHFMLNQLFSENRAFYEIMWTNMVQPDRPQMTI
jgi:hypothetical protein